MGRVNSPILPFVVCVCLCLFSVCNLARGEAGFNSRATFGIHVQYTRIDSSRLRALTSRLSGSLVAHLAGSGDVAYRK